MARPARSPDAPVQKRIQMDMSPRAVERLQRVQARTDSTSYGETVRRSLKLYEAMLDLMEGGGHLFLDRGGEIARIRLVGIDA